MSFISQRAALHAAPLTNQQLSALAPSIFAAEAHESRSARYTYIPTSAVVDGMRANGQEPPSLDRIVPSRGYVHSNVRIISWRANRLKMDENDPSVFDAIAAYLRRELGLP